MEELKTLDEKIQKVRTDTNAYGYDDDNRNLADIFELIALLIRKVSATTPKNTTKQGDFGKFIRDNSLYIKNILENTGGSVIRLERMDEDGRGLAFYIDDEKVYFNKRSCVWAIENEKEITFKFEDYNSETDPVNFVLIGASSNEGLKNHLLNAENPVIKLSLEEGYSSFNINVITDPDTIYQPIKINWETGSDAPYRIYNIITNVGYVYNGKQLDLLRKANKPISIMIYGTIPNDAEFVEVKTGKVLATFKGNNQISFTIDSLENEFVIRSKEQD